MVKRVTLKTEDSFRWHSHRCRRSVYREESYTLSLIKNEVNEIDTLGPNPKNDRYLFKGKTKTTNIVSRSALFVSVTLELHYLV